MELPTRISVACMLALTACSSVGPDYSQPEIELSRKFVEGPTQGADQRTVGRWWLDLKDSGLDELVARGLAQNLDILTSIERINQASAVLRTTGTPALLSGDLGAEASRTRSSGVEYDSSNLSASGNLVLDLFGGQRRAREQAAAQYDASQYDVGTARLAFLSSLVTGYIDARYQQEALALTRESIAARRKTLEIVTAQSDVGVASKLDIANARALLEEAQASLPALENAFNTAVFGIATLQAEPAAPLLKKMQKGSPQPRPRTSAKIGVPADLMRNRPDIVSAERALAAATAAIGIAEADLYPSINLSGSITASSTGGWSFGPTLTLPVLNQPVLRATRDQQISLARQAELAWRSTVLTAAEEVQIAQSTYLRSRKEVSARRAYTASVTEVLEVSTATYQAGTTDLLDLLDAERARAAARLALAEAIQSLATAWVSLKISSGQGWEIRDVASQ